MSTKTCERCGTAPGTQHTFHYGRAAAVADPPVAPVYHASAYLDPAGHGTGFHLGGVDAVTLCHRCLARARARRAARVIRDWAVMPLVAAAYVVLLIGILAWAWAGEWAQAALWLGVGVVATAVAYGLTYLVLRDEDFAQHTAVDLHSEKLRDQGWDAFWTDNEFARLAPH